jgi:5-methylcytosine-specific restriction endonuclease McrA
MTLILALDASGAPARWLSAEASAFYYAKGLVSWDLGDTAITLHGGHNSRTGEQSILAIKSIIAVGGKGHFVQEFRTPAVERQLVFRRDRHLCAYCGDVYRESKLTLDHVVPQSRGGNASWSNLVASCKSCNNRKDARTPEEARMPLLYVPYAPNRHEAFILANRNIRGDQMDFLLHGVPRHSRLHA